MPPAPTEVPKPPAEAPETSRVNHAVRTRPAGTVTGHYCPYFLGGPFGCRSKTNHIILHHPETLGHRVQGGKIPGGAGRGASNPVPAPSSTTVQVTIPDTAPGTSTVTRSPDRRVVVYHQEDQHNPGPAPEEE